MHLKVFQLHLFNELYFLVQGVSQAIQVFIMSGYLFLLFGQLRFKLRNQSLGLIRILRIFHSLNQSLKGLFKRVVLRTFQKQAALQGVWVSVLLRALRLRAVKHVPDLI